MSTGIRWLPNALSISRILTAPLAAWLILEHTKASFILLSVTLLCVLSMFTDMLDGRYARKHGIMTEFGAFIDQFADKVFVLSVFFSFAYISLLGFWFPVVIALREVFMVIYRLLLKARGKDMETSIYGKAKTISQFGFIFVLFSVLALRYINYEFVQTWLAHYSGNILLYSSWLVVLATWGTAFHYIWINSIKKEPIL